MRIEAAPLDIDILKAQSVGRTKGLHASDIYNDFYRKVDPKHYDFADDGNPLCMALGLAWERYLEEALVHNGVRAYRPHSQVSKHGFEYSPDLIVSNGHDRIGEIKLTYKSPTDLSDPKFEKWHTQAMLYCYELEIPRAEFFPIHLIESYGGRKQRALYQPVLKHYLVEYSARELKENFDMLMNHAKHMEVL
jgi:hypothetical protein